MKRTRFHKSIVTLLTFEIVNARGKDGVEMDYGTYFRFKDGMIAVHYESEKHNFEIISKNRAIDFLNLIKSLSIECMYNTYIANKAPPKKQILRYMSNLFTRISSYNDLYIYNGEE